MVVLVAGIMILLLAYHSSLKACVSLPSIALIKAEINLACLVEAKLGSLSMYRSRAVAPPTVSFGLE